MNANTRVRLEDALSSAQTILAWSQLHSRAQLETDLIVESAYVRQFEVIGEALRAARSSDELLVFSFPQIHEWISLRHHIINEYNEVDIGLLWQYATVDIPLLIKQLQSLIDG